MRKVARAVKTADGAECLIGEYWLLAEVPGGVIAAYADCELKASPTVYMRHGQFKELV